MVLNFSHGVDFHKRLGSKILTEAPPWNNNPQEEKYPIYTQNGIFVFNRMEGTESIPPYEVSPNLWIIPRFDAFTASTNMIAWIDAAIANGGVLANYSHPEDGFANSSREGFQTSLAYAKSQVDAGLLWATTPSEIGRYWEAKSDANVVTQFIDGKTIVDITLPDYDSTLFGIPYLTFRSSMPNASSNAKITVDYPSTQVLNSNSSTVRVVGTDVTYTIYLNPVGTTRVEIEGVDSPYTSGVDINKPILSIDSIAPVNPLSGSPVTIQASAQSTDAIYTANVIFQRNSDAKESRIMTSNGGNWEATLGSFNPGDIVHYYVSVTDNSGRRERSSDKSFTVLAEPDLTPPEWRSQGQSSDSPQYGTAVQLYGEGLDNVALSTAVLETDETGVWEARSAYGSPMNLGDVANTWRTSNFTWNNPSVLVNTTVSWRIRYTDSSGLWAETPIMAFTVIPATEDTEPPVVYDPSTNSTMAGTSVEFNTRWTDNVGLYGYVFSIDNGSGSFVDDLFVEFSEDATGGVWWNSDWENRQTITIDNTSGVNALDNYPILVTINTASLIAAGKMNNNGGDIRFVDGSQELDFWVESGINTASTRIWVKIPSIPASAAKTIQMYYGNPNRTVSQSNGSNTFATFDDFGGQGWDQYKYSGNPVMGPGSTAGGSGTFSSVIRESDTLWRMYSSYDSDNRDIGMSTSTDGISWTHQGVVVRKGEAGTWDSSNIWCPAVWKENGTYYMMYPGSGSFGTTMGLATSLDGINWTKYANNPVFNDPNWAQGDTESPCFSVMKDNGTYYVMYNTLGAGKRQSSIAYSTDLINWTPAYNYARFPGGTNPSDWNYNMFCGHMFKYEDLYYVIIPGQDSSHDFAKYGLYISHSPLFPENDTEFKGIVMIGGPTGAWDYGDMDTPWIVPFNNIMHMYYAACGSCWSQTGLAVINDIPLALTNAYPPGNYINTDRSASASLQIMPPVNWQKSLVGYQEVNGQSFDVTLDPSVSGRAIVLKDTNATLPLELFKNYSSMQTGVISAWMRTGISGSGDYDLYASGDSQATLALAAGLGGNGYFHYWNGSFIDTTTSYSANTWYLVQVEFDTVADQYDFAVYDNSYNQILRVDDIAFGAAISAGLDQVKFRTSDSFNGSAYLDDVIVRLGAGIVPPIVVDPGETQVFTNAWARATKVVNSTPGTTIRWRFSASDTNGNWTTSDTYSFVTTVEDLAPTVTLNSPTNNIWVSSASVDFSATCTDETDINSVSLYGDWSGVWSLVDSVSGPNLNGNPVLFSKTLPDGFWTWNVSCTDNTAHTSWGTVRAINVDTTPDPWWHSNYQYRSRLTVNENSGQALVNYPVFVTIDTATLIAAGKMQPDCDDARVTYNGVEITSQMTGCDLPNSKVWIQLDLLANETRQGYYLYYGNPSASAPDYSSQSNLTWNDTTKEFNTGKISGTFDPDGGVITQIRNNANNQNLFDNNAEQVLGYLFSNNPAVLVYLRGSCRDR